MKHAEDVTFGGSGLDRAGLVRMDGATLDALRALDTARAIVMWRGKPLLAGEKGGTLVRLALTHPLIQELASGYIFLGQETDGPVFAADLSRWEPSEIDHAALESFFDPSAQHHPDLPEDHLFRELRGVMTHLNARDAELAATARAVLGWHRSHRFCAKCGAESRMSAGGWQRDCPSCGAHHFPRTDPVVIMLITHGNRVLMGRSPGWPEGMYSLLAGFVEPGETLEAAVRREVFEESGVKVGEVRYLASQPWPYPSSLMMGMAGEAISEEINIDPQEIEDAIWVSREEMMQAFAGEHPVLKPARRGAIAHFLLHNWLADRLD